MDEYIISQSNFSRFFNYGILLNQSTVIVWLIVTDCLDLKVYGLPRQPGCTQIILL
jgi:hypothetical protein